MTSTLPTLQADIWRNPIAWREIVGGSRVRGKWFWRGAYALTALLLIMPLFYSQHYFARSLNDWLAVMMLTYGALFIWVGVRTITAANDVIVRERRGKTWELLMLTGVGTWRLVLGKWAGVMRVALRDFGWLYTVRLGLYIWASGSMSLGYPHYNWDVRDSLTIANIQFNVPFILQMVVLSAVFLALELMLCAALGVLSGLLPWSSRVGTGAAIAMRVGISAALGFGLLWATGIIRPYPYTIRYPDHLNNFIIVIAGTLSDNGAVSSAIYSSPTTNYYDYEALKPVIALAQVIGMSMYAGLTLLALVASERVAHWQGVNSASFVAKSKPKRHIDATPTVEITTDAPVQAETTAVVPVIPKPGAANVFSLPDAEHYRVELFHFGRHLGRLVLRATRGSETVYLQFANVMYLDAPSIWQNASVRAATMYEYQAFLRETKLAQNSLLAETLRLYVIETSEKSIRIVAGSVALLYELSAQWAS